MPPKFCPECRDEFIHAATLCTTCDVALVLEEELSEEDALDELPPVSELVCIRASAVGWALALSEKLSEAGIAHRVQAAGDGDEGGGRARPGYDLPYGVFVSSHDVEAAQAIDVAHTQSEIPDVPADFTTAVDDGGCPACGDPIGTDAAECPGCGLALLTVE